MMKYVIRAGGVGTRLWPYSRSAKPKQFHVMSGTNSMIQDAVERIAPIASPQDMYVSTAASLKDLVIESLPDLPPDHVIMEPALRNTGPAVGLECALLEARYPGCTIASLGSDHLVGRPQEFCRLLEVAEQVVEEHPEYLITLGVTPTRPETGYGYIRKGETLCTMAGETVFTAAEFTEKPDEATARRYLDGADYLWNTNMFVWKASTVLELFARFEPQTYDGLMQIAEAVGGSRARETIEAVYPGLTSIAIDNAIIEPAPHVATLEADLDWGDIGSWAALTDVFDADDDGNLFDGQVVALDARNTTAYGGRDKLIALIGVEDLVVVDTEDVLLVCLKEDAQRVKEIVDHLNSDSGRRYT